jgi:hypothetical protein
MSLNDRIAAADEWGDSVEQALSDAMGDLVPIHTTMETFAAGGPRKPGLHFSLAMAGSAGSAFGSALLIGREISNAFYERVRSIEADFCEYRSRIDHLLEELQEDADWTGLFRQAPVTAADQRPQA